MNNITNYNQLLVKNNLLQWLEFISKTDQSDDIRESASELIFLIKGNSSISKKVSYNDLYLNYKFKLSSNIVNNENQILLYSYNGDQQTFIGVVEGIIDGPDQHCCIEPRPSHTPTITPTLTITPSISKTPSITPTISKTPSITPTNTKTPTVTPTISKSQKVCPTPRATKTVTPTISITPSVSRTPGVTPTVTKTPSITPTITPSITPSLNPDISKSVTPSITPTISKTPSVTPTHTITPSTTKTPSVTPSSTKAESIVWSTRIYSPGQYLLEYIRLSNNNGFNILKDPKDPISSNENANITFNFYGYNLLTCPQKNPNGTLWPWPGNTTQHYYAGVTTWKNGVTFYFYPNPIENPHLALYSVGSALVNAAELYIQTSVPYVLVCNSVNPLAEPTIPNPTGLKVINSTVFYGKESYGIIKFPGYHSSISFNIVGGNFGGEVYTNFIWGCPNKYV